MPIYQNAEGKELKKNPSRIARRKKRKFFDPRDWSAEVAKMWKRREAKEQALTIARTETENAEKQQTAHTKQEGKENSNPLRKIAHEQSTAGKSTPLLPRRGRTSSLVFVQKKRSRWKHSSLDLPRNKTYQRI